MRIYQSDHFFHDSSLCKPKQASHEWMLLLLYRGYRYWWNILCQHKLFANFWQKIIIIYGLIHDWLLKSCDIDVFKLAPFSLKFPSLFKALSLASAAIYHVRTTTNLHIHALAAHRGSHEPRLEPHTYIMDVLGHLLFARFRLSE